MASTMRVLAAAAFVICGVCAQNFQSPCPRLFVYESKNSAQPDRWYGLLTLLSDSELNGVWLRLIFDKPFLQLGVYWPGEITTEDNREYLLKNRDFKLAARTPQTIRFLVRYNAAETPPLFVGFRLNAKTYCPEGGVVAPEMTTQPQLVTSSLLDDGDASNQGGVPDLKSRIQIQCGTVAVTPHPLIRGGKPAREGAYPWHAALYDMESNSLDYICGGSLISETHVVTAGHCVTKQNTRFVKDAKHFHVYLGKHFLSVWTGPHLQDSPVSRVTRHPRYDADTYANDIAVIKLENPATYSDYVRPVCLWRESQDVGGLVGKLGTIVGWGLDDSGEKSEVLSTTSLPIVSKETCIFSDADFFGRFARMGTFCAGYDGGREGGPAPCAGDSGGGMTFPVGGDARVRQLRGIVSLSMATGPRECRADRYTVFTDVAMYLDFVGEAMTK